ncbi:hypothetical protein EV363DRAFT_1157645 [Boletus edulis]|nr:hypothetical protein EV363DRAFT_1157645 [Boletus edulis]
MVVNTFLVVRYIVFAVFTICNAITCSVAVWNYSLVPYPQPAQVDIYLIFLGALSLLSIFALIFIELLCVNALTTRVWFECVWVALFWLMELAGGAALIAIDSDVICSSPTTTILLNALCTSERVLLAFTWMCTTMLLVYLLALVFIAASGYGDDPKIWVCDVRSLRAAAVRQCSPRTPDTPLTPPFKKRVDICRSRPAPYHPAQNFPSLVGFGSEYDIEPFVFATPEQMDTSHLSNLPEATPLPPTSTISLSMKPIPPLPRLARNVRPLSLSQFNMAREHVSSDGQRSGPVSGLSNSLPTPSPLGDWPRQDVMQLPGKPKRKAPPSAFEFPEKHTVAMASTDRVRVSADTAGTFPQPRPRRPSGPRERVPSGESGNRPALNLYSIRV